MDKRNDNNATANKSMTGNNATDAAFQKGTTDERDRQIKNEEGTARLRSERQSVKDNEKDDQAH